MLERRGRGAWFLALSLMGLCAWTDAAAKDAAPLAQDPVLEARVNAVAEELRCLVCQNETIAASRADLANDLRRQIRLQLAAGRTDQQVRDYMVARYGDFVLYRPPLKPTTWLLWLGPFALLAIGATVLVRSIRKQRASAPADAMPAQYAAVDLARARQWLDES